MLSHPNTSNIANSVPIILTIYPYKILLPLTICRRPVEALLNKIRGIIKHTVSH